MNSQKLLSELKTARKELEELKRIEEEEQRLFKVYKSSSCFNMRNITMIVAKLISRVENDDYEPLIFNANFISS